MTVLSGWVCVRSVTSAHHYSIQYNTTCIEKNGVKTDVKCPYIVRKIERF